MRFHFNTNITVPFDKIYTLTEGYTTPRVKVFIGGIPQEMEQDEVKQILHEYAPVKKLWLQRHKETTPGPCGIRVGKGSRDPGGKAEST